MSDDFNESPLIEHLVELRARLVRGLLGLGVVLLALLAYGLRLSTADPPIRSEKWVVVHWGEQVKLY